MQLQTSIWVYEWKTNHNPPILQFYTLFLLKSRNFRYILILIPSHYLVKLWYLWKTIFSLCASFLKVNFGILTFILNTIKICVVVSVSCSPHFFFPFPMKTRLYFFWFFIQRFHDNNSFSLPFLLLNFFPWFIGYGCQITGALLICRVFAV